MLLKSIFRYVSIAGLLSSLLLSARPAQAQLTKKDLAYAVGYGPFLAPFIYFLPLYAPIAFPLLLRKDTENRIYPYDGDLELNVGYNVGLFPDAKDFHAQGSQNIEVSAFYRVVGVSLRLRPEMRDELQELVLAPYRTRDTKSTTEVRGLLLLGKNTVGDDAPETTLGYRLQFRSGEFFGHVAARRFAETKDASFEMRFGQTIFPHADMFLHAENRLGTRGVDTRHKDAGRRNQNQYESVRLSIGLQYGL